MEVYFLKSVACLTIFMLFYKLLLEKENMHSFKRIYLLGALSASLCIPLITFTSDMEVLPLSDEIAGKAIRPVDFESSGEHHPLIMMLWILYSFGVLFFSITFYRNLKGILRKINANPQIKSGTTLRVLVKEDVAPHTFWNYIFLNRYKYERQQIPAEVFEHEQAHAVQYHSVDILLLEIIQVFFWFNPMIYFLKRCVKLNHEFLADRAVLNKGINRSDYQKTLLLFSSGHPNFPLVNPINYLSIKKRFTVMKTQTSKKAIWTRSLLLVPLIAALIFSCSNREELKRSSIPNTVDPKVEVKEVVEEKMEVKEVVEEKLEVLEVVEEQMNTPEKVAEYNKLAKYYRQKGDTDINVKEEGFKRMMYIYSFMTDSQKKNAEEFPPHRDHR